MSDPKKPSGAFWSQLKPASYRGVAFGVISGQARFGRRNALHEYPFRDTPWVEDLGRQSRRIMVTGFLVGDDVIAQRERLVAACEKPGDGKLIHPTLGELTVSLMDFSVNEYREKGRAFELHFVFVEAGKRLFPSDEVNQTQAIGDAADATSAAATSTWTDAINQLITQRTIPHVTGSVSDWVSAAITAGQSATNLQHLTAALSGNFGRMLGLSSGAQQVFSTVGNLIAAGASARASIALAASTLNTAAKQVSSSSLASFASDAQALADAVRTAAPTPADALRGMLSMSTVQGKTAGSEQLTGDLFRRIAVAGAAKASADYQPSSSDEAQQVRSQVTAAIDAEIDVAGNQGDDDVYTALRAMRAQVVKDMNAKGAALPGLITVTTNQPLPALALAQRLYRDYTRADELVKVANPRHPAFMPLSFKALAQ
jgi:prophage DNA circulation protein